MNIKLKIKKQIMMLLFIFSSIILLSSCQNNNQNTNYTISFEMPSDDNLPMPLGRSFYVSGSINSKENIPSDSTFEIDIYNEKGEIVRHVYDQKINSDNYYIYPNMIKNFNSDIEKVNNIIRSTNQCEYLVLDNSNPDESFRNAEIKCSFSDNKFKAFIVGGTDEEHGAAVDDGCNFVNANGNPYFTFTAGKYIVKATLKSKNGEILSSATRDMIIGDPESSLIMRFNPKEYINLMIDKISKVVPNYKTNIDFIPGYMSGINSNIGGRTMLFKANDMALYRNTHTYFQIYLIDPESSSWSVEIPYLYYIDHIDNPDYFTPCRFDIGEPILYIGDKTIEGNIIYFEKNDYHDICRIDEVDNNTDENVFDLNKPLKTAYTDIKNKTITISPNQSFAVMGVLAPTKLDDSFIFDQYNDDIRVTNRIETLAYTFTCDGSTKEYEKPVYLKRGNKEGINQNYDSVLEYYHIFNYTDFEANKTYQVSVIGLDKNGKEIKGTEEKFSIQYKNLPSVAPGVVSK